MVISGSQSCSWTHTTPVRNATGSTGSSRPSSCFLLAKTSIGTLFLFVALPIKLGFALVRIQEVWTNLWNKYLLYRIGTIRTGKIPQSIPGMYKKHVLKLLLSLFSPLYPSTCYVSEEKSLRNLPKIPFHCRLIYEAKSPYKLRSVIQWEPPMTYTARIFWFSEL